MPIKEWLVDLITFVSDIWKVTSITLSNGEFLHFMYYCCTPPNLILQFRQHLYAGKCMLIFSKKRNQKQQWILCPQSQKYAVVNRTMYNDLHVSADCVQGLIRVVKQTDTMHTVHVGAFVELAHLVQENAGSDGIRVSNMPRKPGSGPGSDHNNRSVRSQTSPKPRPPVSRWAKPVPIPANPMVMVRYARLVTFKL